MASGFAIAGGTDLDAVFASGNASLTTGFKVAGGADLGSRYAPYTTGAHVAATGYVVGGADLSSLFQKFGVPPGGPGPNPVIATASPTNAGGDAPQNGTAVSNAVGASANGGSAPYSYAWAAVGDPQGIVANSPASATTSFARASVAASTAYTATFRCTVTDSLGATGTSNDVSVVLSGRPPLAVSVAPGTVFGSPGSRVGSPASTGPTTATATGGAGGYSYSWNIVSGTTSIEAHTPSAATTYFTTLTSLADKEAFFACTVTDSAGNTAISDDVDVIVSGLNTQNGLDPTGRGGI